MHSDAEDAWSGDPRDFAQLDKAESAAAAHERVNGGASQARCAEWGGDLALDHFAGEVGERIFAVPPSGVARGGAFDRVPKRAAAVADYHDRPCERIDRRGAR